MPTKTRILQIVPYFVPHKGGVESVAETYARNLPAFGYAEVCNLTSDFDQPSDDFESGGYRVVAYPSFEAVHNFPIPKVWHPGFWKALEAARNFHPDAIVTHTRFFVSSFLGAVLAKLWRVRHVHVEHGSGSVVSDSWAVRTFSRAFDATFWRWTVTRADAVVAISRASANFVSRAFGRDDASVVYNGIEASPGKRSERGPNDPLRIAFVGRLVSLKGVDVLLSALSKLEIPFVCRIVGDGDERSGLEALSKRLGLSNRVRFEGAKPREEILESILPATDVFVNPSFQEGLPTTVVEALLCGCSVIATDVGGTREIAPEGEGFRVVPAGDAAVLANVLDTVLRNPASFSEEERRAVGEKFSPEGACRNIVARIEDIGGQ